MSCDPQTLTQKSMYLFLSCQDASVLLVVLPHTFREVGLMTSSLHSWLCLVGDAAREKKRCMFALMQSLNMLLGHTLRRLLIWYCFCTVDVSVIYERLFTL